MSARYLNRGFGAAVPLLALAAAVIVIGAVLTFTAALLRARGEASTAGSIDRELQRAAELLQRELRRAGSGMGAAAIAADAPLQPPRGRMAQCASVSYLALAPVLARGDAQRRCVAIGLRDEDGVGRLVIAARDDVPLSQSCPAGCPQQAAAVTPASLHLTGLVFERIAPDVMRFELHADAINLGRPVSRSVHQIVQLRNLAPAQPFAAVTP